MENTNYNCTFTVSKTPQEVFDAICQVQDWWGFIEGPTTHLNDTFTYRPGETHVNFKVTEMIPAKRIAWLATDCFLHWQADKTEWKDTKVVFDITPTSEGTQVRMAHEGLTPKMECYEGCRKGWDLYAGDSLKSLITEGLGKPGKAKA